MKYLLLFFFSLNASATCQLDIYPDFQEDHFETFPLIESEDQTHWGVLYQNKLIEFEFRDAYVFASLREKNRKQFRTFIFSNQKSFFFGTYFMILHCP